MAVDRTDLRAVASAQLGGFLTPGNAAEVGREAYGVKGLAEKLFKYEQDQGIGKAKFPSVLRRVQRWFTPGKEHRDIKKSPKEQKKLQAMLRDDRKALEAVAKKQEGVAVGVDGWVKISNDPPKHRRIPADGFVVLEGENAAEFLQAALTNPGKAWQIFFDAYEVGNARLTEIIKIDLQIF
jgi:hypothetical protein